jgi:hypothetical protein
VSSVQESMHQQLGFNEERRKQESMHQQLGFNEERRKRRGERGCRAQVRWSCEEAVKKRTEAVYFCNWWKFVNPHLICCFRKKLWSWGNFTLFCKAELVKLVVFDWHFQNWPNLYEAEKSKTGTKYSGRERQVAECVTREREKRRAGPAEACPTPKKTRKFCLH